MVRRTSDLADAARTPGIPVQAPSSPRPLAPVDRLRRLGAVPIGRTTTADWASHRGAAGTTFRATVNPWDANRTPGESGDAAAVATGMTPLAVGGDDGGALRLAAQACGVTTLRCTRRRIPAGSPNSFGAPSLALQLFTAHGFTARRVDDLTAAVHAAAVRDPGDPWNSNVPLAGPA